MTEFRARVVMQGQRHFIQVPKLFHEYFPKGRIVEVSNRLKN